MVELRALKTIENTLSTPNANEPVLKVIFGEAENKQQRNKKRAPKFRNREII